MSTKRGVLREEAAEPSVSSLDDARRTRALEELTRLHRGYLLGLARKLCRGQFDADDLVQEVLVKTLQRPIPEGANPRAWLAHVMQNLFIDWVRRRATRREDELIDTPAPVAAEEAWWQQLTADEVRAELAALPQDQRVTFEMFAFEGRSYDEIAAALLIAKATVGTRILRARVRLRELLVARRGRG